MVISLNQFETNNLGKTLSSPEGKFPGECVSAVRQKMLQVDGVVTGPLGNAVDFATNSTFLSYYQEVSNPQNGDIGIHGDDPGNWTGPEGHIWIYYNNQMLNQNYDGHRYVTLNNIFAPGFIGYFRLKGGSPAGGNKMTKEQAQELSLYLRLLDFESVDQANSHSEDDVNHILADPGYAGALAKQIYQGANWQQQSYKASHYDRDLSATQNKPVTTTLKPGVYEVK